MAALPEDVRQFVLSCIDSVEQLEVLLLLHASPEKAWTAAAVASALYSNPESIIRRLAALHEKKLLAVADAPSTYRYQPPTSAVHATVARLAETYRQRRVAVITLIASMPMEKVRAFSDAFRLRRKEPE